MEGRGIVLWITIFAFFLGAIIATFIIGGEDE